MYYLSVCGNAYRLPVNIKPMHTSHKKRSKSMTARLKGTSSVERTRFTPFAAATTLDLPNISTYAVCIATRHCDTNLTYLTAFMSLSPQGWRRMVGCYIGMDEANSKARIKGV